MSNDSHLFRTREQLRKEGFRLLGNILLKGNEVYLPLYEAKMFWHYDHRWGTYEESDKKMKTTLPRPSPKQYSDPSYFAIPWYWVPKEEVEERLRKAGWRKGWLIAFRNIARTIDERTAIFSVLPRLGVGHNAPLLLPHQPANLIPCLLGNLNSIVFDWVARQKIGGVHMDYFHIEQLTVLPPSAYREEDILFIVPRVLELVYTAWDVKAFGDDVWESADEGLRRAIERQWEENARETGGNSWNPPDWLDTKGGISLPPFRWNEDRRARIQAELDAYFAHLFGLNRKQLRYILDPRDLTKKEVEDILSEEEEVRDVLDEEGYRRRCEESDYPSESFRVLKEKEIERFGEYRTRRLILEAWERIKGKR